MNRRPLGALAAGVLFGVGLVVSGMTDPRNVIGFLDFSSRWNPQLIAVMAGAVGVHATLLALLARRAVGPGAAGCCRRATPASIPGSIGSALFGVGWGLSGYCPGPALVSMGFGARDRARVRGRADRRRRRRRPRPPPPLELRIALS